MLRIRRTDLLLLPLLIIFRIFNALVVRTFYSPDEYWQSLEVAHYKVFGYGYLTWEWKQGIRSYIHPMIFALVYEMLKHFGLDTNYSLFIAAPKIVSGVFAGFGDYYTYLLAKKLFSLRVAKWTLILSLLSWYNFYSITRTFSNSFEVILTVAGIFYLPLSEIEMAHYLNGNCLSCSIGFTLAAISIVFRPTAAISWIIIGFRIMWSLQKVYPDRFWRNALLLVLHAIPIGVPVFAFGILADYYLYGEWVFTMWNFFKLNILNNVAIFYGSNPFHWYLSNGIPVLLTSYLPLFLDGLLSQRIARTSKSTIMINTLYVWFGLSLLVLSFLSHKEFRFIHQLLPFMLILSARSADVIEWKQKTWSKRLMLYSLTALVIISQVGFGLFMAAYHQPGVISVMQQIRQDALSSSHEDSYNVFFAMPCHSVPHQSHVHLKMVQLEMLTCEPPLFNEKGQTDYMDDTALFYSNASKYLKERLSRKSYQSIIMFEDLLESDSIIQTILRRHKFHITNRIYNSVFIDDDRKSGDVLIYRPV